MVVRIEIVAQAKNTHFTIKPSIRTAPRRREIIWPAMFLDSCALIGIFLRIPYLHRPLFKPISNKEIPNNFRNEYLFYGTFLFIEYIHIVLIYLCASSDISNFVGQLRALLHVEVHQRFDRGPIQTIKIYIYE